jgi:hypothetical protein
MNVRLERFGMNAQPPRKIRDLVAAVQLMLANQKDVPICHSPRVAQRQV